MMVDLKPCPFCGEKNDIGYGFTGSSTKVYGYVQCAKCGAKIRSKYNGNYMEAIKAWNRRAETVKEQPAADVTEVRHSKWLTWEEQFPNRKPSKNKSLGVFCNNCRNHSDNITDYCPNCGAKMDGKAGDEV